MAPISGPDLILDVIQARSTEASSGVSPKSDVRARAVQQVADAPEGAFEQIVRDAAAGTEARRDAGLAEAMPSPSSSTVPSPSVGASGSRAVRPAQTPEAMLQGLLLKSVVEVMLPKEGGSFFGDGTAGSVWRSMLAQHVADELNEKIDLRLIPKAGPARPEAPGGEGRAGLKEHAPAAIAAQKPRVREI